MNKWVIIPAVVLLAGLSFCDGPDQIYRPLPKDYDPAAANGISVKNGSFTGEKSFKDETLTAVATGPTVEVCTDTELNDKWAWMVNQPIVPMVGAAGLDMTGGAGWSGLTMEDSQSKEGLCQSLYTWDGGLIWGDNFEVVAWYDRLTRKIYGMRMNIGYLGTIQAGPYSFGLNVAVTKDGTQLSRRDGSARDPRTDANMIDINRKLLAAFRPGIFGGPESVDCIASGSCFVLVSGTLPILVFQDVGVYVILEPTQMRINNLQIYLKRPFNLGRSDVAVAGSTPTLSGIGSCSITYGTKWSHFTSACLGSDPLAMAEVRPTDSYERLVGDFGGVSFWFKRGLAIDEILGLDDTMQPDDEVTGMAFGTDYEGNFAMDMAAVLTLYKAQLISDIKDEAGLADDELTGVELLRLPGDASLPAAVAARYPNRLRPGNVTVAFCEDDGPDPDAIYDSCMEDDSGRPVIPLTVTMASLVATQLGDRLTTALAQPSFYVDRFLTALFTHIKGSALTRDQVTYQPSADSPEIHYGTLTIRQGSDNFTMDTAYDDLDDRLHFLTFYKGANRPESVLYRDAAEPMLGDPSPTGVFKFDRLVDSPRLGFGSTKITIDRVVPETRRAVMTFRITESDSMQVLAPYLEAGTTVGYSIPIEGNHNLFQPADYLNLYGRTISAELLLAPSADDPGKKEVVAIGSGSFFGPVSFCGQTVSLGDWADTILEGVIDDGYPCTLILGWSEGGDYILSMSSVEDQKRLAISNERVGSVFAWLR